MSDTATRQDIDELLEILRDFINHSDNRFNALDGRFDGLEERFDHLELEIVQ
ncbi:hypothetical protein HY218_01100 [Candidatus Saccharibacteria bacterium]|nr:hypothetical protein [Candidatus Saccharibacteria bacterium]